MQRGERSGNVFGKRPDGRRIKGIDPIIRITPYVMPMRCDAQVFLKYAADMDILSRYIRAQKREKNEKITYMQIVVAAYVRAVSRNPEANRFIMNKQLFARNNCSAAFTILGSTLIALAVWLLIRRRRTA